VELLAFLVRELVQIELQLSILSVLRVVLHDRNYATQLLCFQLLDLLNQDSAIIGVLSISGLVQELCLLAVRSSFIVEVVRHLVFLELLVYLILDLLFLDLTIHPALRLFCGRHALQLAGLVDAPGLGQGILFRRGLLHLRPRISLDAVFDILL